MSDVYYVEEPEIETMVFKRNPFSRQDRGAVLFNAANPLRGLNILPELVYRYEATVRALESLLPQEPTGAGDFEDALRDYAMCVGMEYTLSLMDPMTAKSSPVTHGEAKAILQQARDRVISLYRMRPA